MLVSFAQNLTYIYYTLLNKLSKSGGQNCYTERVPNIVASHSQQFSSFWLVAILSHEMRPSSLTQQALNRSY